MEFAFEKLKPVWLLVLFQQPGRNIVIFAVQICET
jgi:uncharacterized protein Smg (DUF494 family)